MSAGDLAVTLAALLCTFGFAALIVVLMRVLDTLKALRIEVESLRRETGPLLADLRESTDDAREAMDTAREDLERFDRVLGSAEAISGAVEGSSRLARRAFSVPVIKAAGIATGTSRTVRRLRRKDSATELVAGGRAARRARPSREWLELSGMKWSGAPRSEVPADSPVTNQRRRRA